jgi:excisionase family DNA binding protein
MCQSNEIESTSRHLAEQSGRLLTPEEAASVLRIGRTRIYELIGRSESRSIKIGKSRRIRRVDLDDFIGDLSKFSWLD